MNIRGGIIFPNINQRIPFGEGFQGDLNQLVTAFELKEQESGPTDFYALLNEAVNSFWPSDFVRGLSVPRYMITVIGGPDTHGAWTSQELLDWQTLRAQRGVESWAV